MRVVFILCLLPFLSFSQVRCGLDSTYFTSHPESITKFENWILNKQTEKIQIQRQSSVTFQTSSVPTETVYRVPVVFHIIHNGELIGEGSNLHDSIIHQQLRILNEDFRRQNADTVFTPFDFKNVAADTKIEFVLAKQDPEGRPTSGILRKEGSKEKYNWCGSSNPIDDALLKSESYWPAEDYFNIYVADLVYCGSSNLLGYATFPLSTLDGLDNFNNDRLTDAVVVDFKYVGINDDTGGSFNSFGRTLTHEVGHFFGLRHVWGDGGCSVDDFVEDTPLSSDSYGGDCPTSRQESCNSSDMYSNYLNYTNDACMNAFTLGQKDRMRVVLENSPRRYSLLFSHALEDPQQFQFDLGIKNAISPTIAECEDIFLPSVEVRNYGTDTLNSYTVSLLINDVFIESIYKEDQLNPNETDVISFAEISIPPNLDNRITFSITSVNNTIDERSSNNVLNLKIPAFLESPLPFELNFDDQVNYDSRSSSGNSLWELVNVPNEVLENKAATIGYYKDSSRYGQFDYLFTPLFDLSALNSAELSFEFAYSKSADQDSKDGLIVAVSTDCGDKYPTENYIYEQYGNDLVTSANTDTFFIPSGPQDWKKVNLNLTKFTGNDKVRVAFIQQIGNGNALYLDNIKISSNSLKAYDLGVRSIRNLSVVTCDDFIIPTVEIKNHGFETITSFELSYTIENKPNASIIDTEILNSGELKDIPISFDNLEDGKYKLTVRVSNPDGEQDEFSENDLMDYHFVVDRTEESLPLRENFEENSDWIITNSTNNSIWSKTRLGTNSVLKANAYGSLNLGTRHWFISPLLQTGDLDSLSMRFRYSYAKRGTANDRLRVLLSTNCGKDFQYVLFDKFSEELSDYVSNEPYVPVVDSLWQTEEIDLSQFTLWNDVRIAFVFDNGNGNNLFLDDIEFFTEATPPDRFFENEITVYPNPATDYINLSLNLEKKQDIFISLIDISGKIVYETTLPNALNQNLRIETASERGYYILKISGPEANLTKRVFINR